SEFRALPLPLRYNPPQQHLCVLSGGGIDMELGVGFTTIVIIIVVIYLLSSIKILAEYERGVIFRLGRLLTTAKGPGIALVFSPIDPNKAVVEVSNYVYQTSQFAQTTLRSVLGEQELDELLAHREKINLRLQSILDQHTSPWGVKVTNVEVKQV